MAMLRTLAVALLPGALALRLVAVPSSNDTLSNSSLLVNTNSSRFHRQQLDNVQDLQYVGNLSVGGQSINGIFDTGSFELVLFSTSCPNCGSAPAYSERDSATFQWGNVTQVHAYGSGSCDSRDGYDTVAVGSIVAKRQPLWLAMQCDMPVLAEARFNGIVGIGPPGQPALTAKATLRQIEEMEKNHKDAGESIPDRLLTMKSQAEKAFEAAKSKHELLDAMGVSTFSTCLGRKPDSPGYLIWNDETRKGQPGVQEIPVAGNITWGVAAANLSFHGHSRDEENEIHIACGAGCGAIVDTGTSLIALPSAMYQGMVSSLKRMGVELDCSDLSHFPDLTMELGGQHIRFPPSAYIGSIVGEVSAEAARFVRTEKLEKDSGAPCHLLVMDLGPTQQTAIGPMLILGMPFFREYYTTFDLSGGAGNRSIFVSPANDRCEPDIDGLVSSDRSAHSLRYTPRQVNASALRVPTWYRWGEGDAVRHL